MCFSKVSRRLLGALMFGKSCLAAMPCREWVLSVQEWATVVPAAISRTLWSQLLLPPHCSRSIRPRWHMKGNGKPGALPGRTTMVKVIPPTAAGVSLPCASHCSRFTGKFVLTICKQTLLLFSFY